jgi:hypothetical protein
MIRRWRLPPGEVPGQPAAANLCPSSLIKLTAQTLVVTGGRPWWGMAVCVEGFSGGGGGHRHQLMFQNIERTANLY